MNAATIKIIHENADGYFVASLNNGGVRVGLLGCECFDFNENHEQFDRCIGLEADEIEAAHDEFMGRYCCNQ